MKARGLPVPMPMTEVEAEAKKIVADALMRAERRVMRARTLLMIDNKFVFWSMCALHLELVPTLSLPLMGVDGRHLFYNPLSIASPKLDDVVIIALVAHEAGHCALLHMTRRGERESRRWNVAADRALNPLLVEAGLQMWKGALYNKDDLGKSVERIYNEVTDDEVDKYFPKGGGDCGGGGVVLDAPSSEAAGEAAGDDIRNVEHKWEVIARQAAYTAAAQGHIPGAFSHLLTPQKPKLDPRSILRQFMTLSRRSDYTWSRPNRRMLYRGLYTPSLRSEGVGPIVIGIDVSGSIDNATCSRFLGFANSASVDVQPELMWLLQCDSQIQSAECFASGEALPTNVVIKGRGGTSMQPIWEWQRREGIEPVCSIVLTDMEMSESGFGPKGGPDHPVLWVSSSRGIVAPFGTTVEMPE